MRDAQPRGEAGASPASFVADGVVNPFLQRARMAMGRIAQREGAMPFVMALRDQAAIVGRLAMDRNRGAFRLHLGVERRRRARREANAAVRRLAAERADRVRPMDRELSVEE